MRRRRHLIVLALSAALAVAPGAAFAQSAGDEQYADPFGDTSTTSTSTTAGKGSLSPTPQTSTTPPNPTPTAPPTTPAPATPSSGELARTGIDTRLFLALGAALLVAGLGLRMRSAPERF